MTSNAQITLEHTFNGTIDSQNLNFSYSVFDGILVIDNKVYDSYTYDFLGEFPGRSCFISRGIFTNDATVTGIVIEQVEDLLHLYIKNINGVVICDLGTWYGIGLGQPYVFKVGDSYKLAVPKSNSGNNWTDIYSLPGKGIVTDVDETPAPRRNGRKYLHNDQVLIDSDDNTYTTQGRQIK